MDVSVNWLRALAPALDADVHALSERLASVGAPVEGVVEVGAQLRDVRIARVLEVRKHPNADRLSLCQVDAGTGEVLPVVCGAPNVRADQCYPYAPVGAVLPGDFRISKRKIRGEWSMGMLCSPSELALGRDHDGLLELRGEYEPGAPFSEAVGLDDVRLTIEVTPNRGDLLSHLGVAREVAPDGDPGLTLPAFADGAAFADLTFVDAPGTVEAGGARVRVEDAQGCPIYSAAIIRGVRVGPSPEWLASRLRAIGSRPINNVVDATNYVLHELGQPMHAFDLDTLQDGIVVRQARAGERLRTLDGGDRKLEAGMLVIADASRPVALAGVMGGEATEVGAGTTNVLLETAIFDPRAIRATRSAFDLSTDASYRFERGVDPDGVERAVARTIALIVATAGGTASEQVACVRAPRPERARIELRVARVRQVLGVALTLEEVSATLTPLGFEVFREDAGRLRVAVPGHRSYDVTREEDLVEEVARRYGYEEFPSELRPMRPSVVPDDEMARLENRLRAIFVGRGLLEARSSPFAPEPDGDVVLLKPLSAAEGRLRRDLTPGLLRRVESNHNRGERDVRLFEIGTAFAIPDATGNADGDGAAATPAGAHLARGESTRLAVVVTGSRAPAHWSDGQGDCEIWDLAGLLADAARVLHANVEPAATAADDDADTSPWLDGREAYRVADASGGTIGWAGRVRDGAVDAPPWAAPHYAFEVALPTPTASTVVTYEPVPAHPASDRDLALIVPESTAAAAIEATIRAAGAPLLETTQLFDLYRGDALPDGTRSLAFRLRFRAQDRTLKDEEVDVVVDRVLDQLRERHNVERRG